MKKFNCLIATIAFIGLLLVGCSDKSQSPIAPTDEQGSLEKVTTINYTATITIVGLVDPGSVKIVGQNMIVKDRVVLTRYESSSPLVTGDLLITINFRYNLNTGEGPSHGKWSNVPDAFPDAVWEGSFTGYRTKTGESEWTENVYIVGKGEGGVIDGMKNFADGLIYSTHIYEETGFVGEGSGVLKSK
ncbi:MAG: hypothetical protein A2W30_07305 [Ignavibacteria bacterium RBG_16_36_9]|nr:MAG: hypothetical protein A2W30_07305 [Ignavibacteria bacterium RBG_16_36_9]